MEQPAPLAIKLLLTCMVVYACQMNKPLPQASLVLADTLTLQQVNGIYLSKGQPFSGRMFSLFDNKKDTQAIASFRDGKEDGEWSRFYAAGKPMEKRFYSNGKKTGICLMWWPNGKQKAVYHFVNGDYEGNCREWNEEGLLMQSMNYHEGHEEGLQTQYFDNGKIKANYVMRKGQRYGMLGRKMCANKKNEKD